MTIEKMNKLPYLKRQPRGSIQRDFLGESHLVNGKWVRQGGLTEEELAPNIAWGGFERWSKAIASIAESWDEIPQVKKVKRGELILYRLNDEIPNIHGSFYLEMPVNTVVAYPVKVDSVQKGDDGISSIIVTETRFTSFRNPLETFRSFGGSVDRKKTISKMRKAGYLRDEQMTIPVVDVRLFDDINRFLAEKFSLSLSKMPQELEAIYGDL